MCYPAGFIYLHFYCLTLYHIASQTFQDPNKIKNILKFQVGYVWLANLKIHRAFRYQVYKEVSNSFSPSAMNLIKIYYSTNNSCVIAVYDAICM